MSRILELREKRAKAWEAAKKFLDSKRGEDGLLSAEDTAAYEKTQENGEIGFENPVAMPGAVSIALDPNGEPLEGVNKIAKTIENKGFSRKGKADGKNFVRWKPLHILERCKEKRQGKTAVRHGLGIVFKL